MSARPCEALRRILPSTVVTRECGADESVLASLFPEERAVVAPAVRKRRAEFAAGRIAARSALCALGFPDTPILPGPDRAPIWPGGVIGSIAHAGDRAIAAVARATAVGGLGIDLERDEAIEEDLWSSILTGREIELLEGVPGPDRGRTVRAVFTAKEAVYKCVYPRIRAFLEFSAVEIALDGAAGRFEVRPRREMPVGFPAACGLIGRVTRDRGYVISAVHLRT
jgi:4'-phosphopantetheinyl transferase EntD